MWILFIDTKQLVLLKCFSFAKQLLGCWCMQKKKGEKKEIWYKCFIITHIRNAYRNVKSSTVGTEKAKIGKSKWSSQSCLPLRHRENKLYVFISLKLSLYNSHISNWKLEKKYFFIISYIHVRALRTVSFHLFRIYCQW